MREKVIAFPNTRNSPEYVLEIYDKVFFSRLILWYIYNNFATYYYCCFSTLRQFKT